MNREQSKTRNEKPPLESFQLTDLLFLRDTNGDIKVTQADIDEAEDVSGDEDFDQEDIDIIMQQWGLDLSPWFVS